MTADNGQKKLFSVPAKVLATVLLFAGTAMCSVFGMLFLQLADVCGGDPIADSGEDGYYATSGCGWRVTSDLLRLSDVLAGSRIYDTDGRYDPEQIVDITQDYSGGMASVEADANVSYTIEDLYQIYICGLADELAAAADDSEYMSFPDAQEGYAVYEEALSYMDSDTWEHLKATGSAGSYSSQFLYLYGRAYPMEASYGFETAAGGTLADYAAAHPEEASLRDLYADLAAAGQSVYEYVWDRQNTDPNAEGNTNLRYYITDGTVVYTNEQQWRDMTEEEVAAQLGSWPMHITYVREGGKISESDFPQTAAGYQLANTLSVHQLLSGDERVCIGLDAAYPIEDGYREAALFYERFAPYSLLLIILAIAGLALAVTSFVLCTVQAGRSGSGSSVRLYGFDSVPTEVAAALGIVLGFLLLIGFGTTFFAGLNAFSPLWYILYTGYICGSLGVFMVFYLSLVRRIKAHNLWERSLIRAVINLGEKVYEARQESSRLIMAGVGLMLLHFICLPVLGVFGFLICLAADILVLLYMLREAAGKQNVIEGMRQLGSGNLDYKVETAELNGNNRELAEVVNSMGDGLKAAVEERMKNERMQADLITNVSHDIKTPLTSIINYVDLLKQENIENPKVRGYIDILERKSQRLKQLAEDLVEASKASSGNVKMEFVVLNLNELVQQVNGEFDERLAARDLEIICSLPPEPSLVRADGRYLWRVIENLYGNVAKYAMPKSRVYTDVSRSGGMVVFTIKNMSEQTLNVSPDELMERFVRGDASRTTEGSGLGLSIAKNLTKLMDGTLEIIVDGDLFKVCVSFPEVVRREPAPRSS